MNREAFLRITTGLMAGVGLSGVWKGSAVASADAGPEEPGQDGDSLDPVYLEKGLTGMASAPSWFPVHMGAAVLGGYYLCRENRFDGETKDAIKAQLDALVDSQPRQFAPLPEEKPDPSLVADLAKAVAPAMEGGLRAHGHAVIFATLAIRALRDAPHMARPGLVEKLCGLSRQIASKKPKPPARPVSYGGSQAMVEATFDSLARFKDLLGRPLVPRPNFTHMVTHTEALWTLESLGFRDLARTGWPGQAAHIDEPVPAFDPKEHPRSESPASLEEISKRGYWEDAGNVRQWEAEWNQEKNPNGYWVAFGHLFKVLYSYHRLTRLVEDKEKVDWCSRILLERYVHPAVRGG